MNNLISALLERITAVYIERIAGSKITTIAGILGIAGTAVSQFTTYIPTPYSTYVTLAGVIIAGVAAILARDSAAQVSSPNPQPFSGSSSTAKLGCWALIAILTFGTMPMMGCNATAVAQDIVNWTPTLQGFVATVDTTGAVLDAPDAVIFSAATVGFDAGSNLLVAQAKAYLANPNATVLGQLQTAVVTFQQTVNSAVLAAAKITNTASQQHALAAINGVATVVSAILALVQSISTKAQVAQMAAESPIKLARVDPYMDKVAADRVIAMHYGVTLDGDQARIALERAGF